MHFAEKYFRLILHYPKEMTEKEFTTKIQLLVSLYQHTIA